MELRTLADVERYLEGFLNRERTGDFDYEKLGLERIRTLMRDLGHPERSLRCVHIAGSKGKGSVALAVERLLCAAGQRVGTYTSPHLESWRERFRIDAAPVDEALLVATLRSLQPVTDRLRKDPELAPSFFDVCTALALLLFRNVGVGACVIEVGLGGRLDSTNVIEPRVSVLTSVELEHTAQLGSTLEKIALEKAGILRSRIPLVHGPLPPEALAAVTARAIAEDTPMLEVQAREVESDPAGLRMRLEDGRGLLIAPLGRHQATNLALAIRAAELFLDRPLGAEELATLESLRLPARIERFDDLILDCAHTPDSARALRQTLLERWPERPWVLVLSISRDKEAASILAELAAPTRAAVLTSAEPQRSLPAEELARLAQAAGIAAVQTRPHPEPALACARSWKRPGELLVVAGSLYLAGALRGGLVREAGASSGVTA